MNRYDPDRRHRRSIRLRNFDYSQAGAYFITICTYGRQCLFGEIVDNAMRMNDFGQIVMTEWLRSAELRKEIVTGECVVMPNHFHGIVIFNDVPDCRGTARRAPTVEQFGKPVAGSLPTIIRSFKSAVTKHINERRSTPGLSVWQRNYHEHVIRNDADYNRIAEYVAINPQRWIEDKLHPDNFQAICNDANVRDGGGGGDGANVRDVAGGVGARRAVPLRSTARPGDRHE